MKKGITIAWAILIASIISTYCVIPRAEAQIGDPDQESVSEFVSNISVNTDNSVDVTEIITYNTGSYDRHGIYRDIYPYSSTGSKMNITDIYVNDEKNLSYPFQTSSYSGNFRIKIGDPNVTFNGQKTYVIHYRATHAVAHLKDLDEIYWNVTGNDWKIPIYSARASVTTPTSVGATQSACYFGIKGSKSRCSFDPATQVGGTYTFSSPSMLNPYEGLTVAVGFPKGIVAEYSKSDDASDFFSTHWQLFLGMLLPILTLIFSFMYWNKNGRDPKGTGVIVPQYDVPDGLTPFEVGGIVSEKVDPKNISSEIIYLATKGYLKINQTEERFIGLIKTTDYELIKLKDSSDLPNDFDREIMNYLFSGGSDSVKLSDLKYVFYSKLEIVRVSILDALLNKGYYKNLGKMKSVGMPIVVLIFMAIWASGFFGGITGAFLESNPLPIIVGIFMSIIIYAIFRHLSPAKTEKGVAAKEYILGLKDYLKIAEKDRLLFHNAPEKKPEVFEKLLPFAMVLGVAEIWAKEFEGIYTTPPSWYSGPQGSTFGAVYFCNSLSHFSSYASSSLSSTPGGSGGSGGGGSSGGGGGGGGGGGW